MAQRVGCERAAVLSVSKGGVMSTLFAATYPERPRCSPYMAPKRIIRFGFSPVNGSIPKPLWWFAAQA